MAHAHSSLVWYRSPPISKVFAVRLFESVPLVGGARTVSASLSGSEQIGSDDEEPRLLPNPSLAPDILSNPSLALDILYL